jgi:hypothetical protein
MPAIMCCQFVLLRASDEILIDATFVRFSVYVPFGRGDEWSIAWADGCMYASSKGIIALLMRLSSFEVSINSAISNICIHG